MQLGMERVHKDNNNSGIRIINCVTSKYILLRAQCSNMGTSINTPGSLLMGCITRLMTYRLVGDGIRVYSMHDLAGELTVMHITVWWLQRLGKDWQEVNK
jgi:hypothetical protein